MARDRAPRARRPRQRASRSRRGSRSIRSTSPTSTAGPTRASRRRCGSTQTPTGSRVTTGGLQGSRAGRLACRAPSRSQLDGELDEDAVTALFQARGPELGAVLAAADELRRETSGDEVTYVVTRNINYTNVCYFRCGFCAFSKGKLAENLRGAPYLVPLDEVVRRCREAWERGAVEVCLQGGIHPAFTGDYYVEIVRGDQARAPRPARARLLGARGLAGSRDARAPARRLPRAPARRRARVPPGHGRRDPRRRGPADPLPGQGHDRAVARGARDRARGGPALDGDDHVRVGRRPAKLGEASDRRARPPEADGRLHRARPAPVRPHGGAHLSQGRRAAGADLPRGGADARGGAAGAPPAHPEHPDVLGEDGRRGRAGVPRGRSERPRRDAHERVDLARGRRVTRPGDAARGDGGGDPRHRAHAEAADDALRHSSRGTPTALLRRAAARRAAQPARERRRARSDPSGSCGPG